MKSAKTFAVVREFRGSVLFLVSIQRSSLAFVWTADSSRARRFETMHGAMAAASLALNEYGASVTVKDADGCLAQPAAAVRDPEPVGVASRAEFRRIISAAQSDRIPACAHVSGCSMPAEPGDVYCADCRSSVVAA